MLDHTNTTLSLTTTAYYPPDINSTSCHGQLFKLSLPFLTITFTLHAYFFFVVYFIYTFVPCPFQYIVGTCRGSYGTIIALALNWLLFPCWQTVRNMKCEYRIELNKQSINLCFYLMIYNKFQSVKYSRAIKLQSMSTHYSKPKHVIAHKLNYILFVVLVDAYKNRYILLCHGW